MAAGAAGVLLRGDAGFEAQLKWCSGGVHPLANKRLRLLRGGLEGEAVVRVWFEGPEVEAQVVGDHRGGDEWLIALSYRHPDLIAGAYRYWVEVKVGTHTLVSEPLEYMMRGFRFGA